MYRLMATSSADTYRRLPVDVMPFGEVEDPDGISSPAARREDLIVFGFHNVFERAAHLSLLTAPWCVSPSRRDTPR
jgi:predicted nucleotidyltransferase